MVKSDFVIGGLLVVVIKVDVYPAFAADAFFFPRFCFGIFPVHRKRHDVQADFRVIVGPGYEIPAYFIQLLANKLKGSLHSY
ncbi:hypothetical protein SDC9_147680 [bioreactor metagenome]|uniref:Uncharacterized protein n=1 Tax=bioreactor metagenome TaxID=1076179 RepID=A0A645EEK4_9ZZZZ